MIASAVVGLVRCESYTYLEVKKAVEKGLDLLGGCQRFIHPGERLLLKPNLLAAVSPEQGVTTHPSVFRAVAETFIAAGAQLSYGDSPAFDRPEKAARQTGLQAVAEDLGLKFADFNQGEKVSFPDGKQNKQFIIAKGVIDSDGIISLPKLKTHGLTLMTGAIKNQFGCIPGFHKGEFHVKLQGVDEFSRMLVDLNRLLAPRLFIMDSIIAMEGNGPRNGKPRKMNALLFSTDPVALDAVACRLIGLIPEKVPPIRQGRSMGLGNSRPEEIKIVGESLTALSDPHFDIGQPPRIWKAKSRWLRNRLIPRPEINPERCVKCGICVKMCPLQPGAVDWPEGNKQLPPAYNYNRCIRCYCCQEVCSENAIHLKPPLLLKLINPGPKKSRC